MEQKLLPQFTKSIEDRTVVGIFAVHGNVDTGNDRSWPGSFSNVSVNGRNRARFLWMHNSYDPPIAAIDYIKELTRDELPTSVLGFAPDATGGVEVRRTYLDTPRGNEVLAGIKAGVIEEMSYAYDVTRSDFEEIDGVQVRNIREIKLYDVSDVTWGLNPATVAVKSRVISSFPLADHFKAVLEATTELVTRADDIITTRIDQRTHQVRSGRVFSAANVASMVEIRDAHAALLTKFDELLTLAEPQKSIEQEVLRLRSASSALRRTARDLGVQV